MEHPPLTPYLVLFSRRILTFFQSRNYIVASVSFSFIILRRFLVLISWHALFFSTLSPILSFLHIIRGGGPVRICRFENIKHLDFADPNFFRVLVLYEFFIANLIFSVYSSLLGNFLCPLSMVGMSALPLIYT